MRRLTEIGVPFSFSFKPYSKSKQTTSAVKHVERALLRPGLRKDQSDLSDSLVAYTEYPSGEPKFFHISLLQSFNDYKIETQ